MSKPINQNTTTIVVREAMRLVSKDVRAPRVVREGLVTPIKEKSSK